MRQVTLCFLVKQDEICIAMKKRGFGVGKWNGFGGKVGDGETIKQATIRELEEEAGVVAREQDLLAVARIKFWFNDKPKWNQEMHAFFIESWQGEPTESQEMKPSWFNKKDLPYDTMWVDDKYWLPQVLAGQKINAEFYFNNLGDDLDKYDVREVTDLNLSS